ncbi:2OG-Fe(II) oxygenase superfamily-domain-containing protein [Obelidium mucronatum]|nr:2OG-Fe(II) oxygenase superfamily-domain-containing protein [Obelidium mucronatum]
MVKKCLREWTCRPNVTNLDTHYVIEEAKGLWSVYEREWKMRQQGGSLMDTVVERRVGLGGMEAYTDDEEEDPGQVVVKSEKEGIAKKVKTERVVASCGSCATPKTTVGSNLKTLMKSGCGNAKDKEEVVVDVDAFKSAAANAAPVVGDSIPIVPEKIDPPTTVTPLLQPLPVSALIKKWRWSSLGWQYNWTKKKYHMDRPVQFPPELDEMTRAVIGSVEELTGYSKKEYKSEAGIVNFYQMSDALMGHQDRSEVNMDAPLVSFSLGHSCIIVIGTESREDRDPLPISFVLRSGDIIVMSGPSRKVFHGVPRILSNSLPAHLSRNQNDDDKDWPVFASFLSTTRININVRQII